MPEQLGSGYVRIGAELRDLYKAMADAKGLTTRTMKEIGAQRARPKVELDLSAIERQIKSVQKDLDLIDQYEADPEVDLDTAAFEEKRRQLEAELTVLTRNRDIVINMDVDQLGAARAELAKFNREIETGRGPIRTWLSNLGRIRVQAGFTSLSIRQLVVSLGTLGPALISVTGSVVALAGSLGEALVGAATVAAGALGGLALSAGGIIAGIKPMMTQLKNTLNVLGLYNKAVMLYGKNSDQAKNYQDQLNEALKNMSPPAKKAFEGLRSLQSEFLKRTHGMQKPLIQDIDDAIQTAKKLLPDFARQSTATFRVASRGFQDWMKGLRSPEAQHIIDAMMANFRKALPSIMHGLGQIGVFLGRIGRVGSQFLPGLARDFDQWATGIAHGVRNTHQLHQEIGGMVDQFRDWMRFLGATGRLLTTVLGGGAKAGDNLLNTITKLFNKWDAFLNTQQGQRSMHRFFAQSVSLTKQIGAMLGKVFTIMFDISRATEPFVEGMLMVANFVGDVGHAVASMKGLRPILVDIGVAMATIWAVNKIAVWTEAAEIAFARVGASLNSLTGAFSTAGRAGASTMWGSFGKAIPSALAAIGLVNIVTAATNDDWKQVGFSAGGAILGGIVGTLVPGIGTILGAGAGSLLGGLFGGLFGGSSDAQKAETGMSRLRDGVKAVGRAYRQVKGDVQAYKHASQQVDQSHDKVTRTAHRVHQAEQKVAQLRQKFGRYSEPALRAERQLSDATRAHNRALEAQKRAERASAAQAKFLKNEMQSQLPILRQNNRQEKEQVQHLQRHLRVAQDAGARDNILRRINDKLTKAQKDQGDTQVKINRLLSQAATQLGPKVANQLADQSRKQTSVNQALGQTQQQVNKTTGELDRWTRRLQAQNGVARETQNAILGKILNPFKDVERQAPQTSRSVDSSMQRSDASVRQHAGNMNSLLQNQIQLFGGKLPGGSGIKKQKGGDVQGHQTGGFTVPGRGSGDRYFTMVPNGSFVLNRNASRVLGFQGGGAVPVKLEAGERVFMPNEVRAIGPALQSLNSSIPRFAKGGAPNFYGHPSNVDPAIRKLIAVMETHFPGLIVSATTDGNHVSGSYHYKGEAVDMSSGDYGLMDRAANYVKTSGIYKSLLEGIHNPNLSVSDGHFVDPSFYAAVWAAHRNHIHMAASGAIKAAIAKIKLPRFSATRPSTTGSVDGLNLLAAVMEQYGNRQARQSAMSGEGSANVGPGVLSRNEMRKLLKAHGMPDIMGWVAQAESGFNPHAVNASSGAFGLWQDLPSTYAGLGVHGDRWDPNVQAEANAKLYARDGLSPWASSQAGWGPHQGQPFALGGLVGMQEGGMLKPGHNGHTPGHPGAMRLPPKPHGKPKKDFSTGPNSWYSWYQTAIDFYNSKGDRLNDLFKYDDAKGNWRHALREVSNEEEQVTRIIHHDKRRIHKLLHPSFHDLPKHLRKTKPSDHFRSKKKGESHKDYHKAKEAWRHRRNVWRRQRDQYIKGLRDRARGIRQELPDLYRQRRIDLPQQYQDIQAKIKGQATDIGLEQTASGQERYQALVEFGGNFVPLGAAFGTPGSRFGTTTGGRFAATRTFGGSNPGAMAASSRSAGTGIRGSSTASSGGGGTTIHNKNVSVNNYYHRGPEDTHTYSAGLRHELGALM